MSLELRFDVSDEDAGGRLDRSLLDWLEQNEDVPPISRAHLQRLIRDGAVCLNSKKARSLRRFGAVILSLSSLESLKNSKWSPKIFH